MQSSIKAVVMRGGTSRAVVFRAEDLPCSSEEQDRILLAAMGSPDPYGRQVDGLGGGNPLTSKAAIVRRSDHPQADVDYTFAQVSITDALVDRRGNCGNISSAIGPYAVAQGLVDVTTPETEVRILNTNTGKVIVAHVPTPDGAFDPDGDFALPGVAGTGARIVLDYLDPAGSVTGELLPTGRALDILPLPGGAVIAASIVDAANPLVFVRLADVGLTPDAHPDDLDADTALLARLEQIRAAAAVAAGLAPSPEAATRESPSVPKLALAGPRADYLRIDGTLQRGSEVDIVVRSLTMGRVHRAFQLTGGICTAVAAAIPGTIVAECANLTPGTLRIGHPSGTMELTADVATLPGGGWRAAKVSAARTARLLMEGHLYVPRPRPDLPHAAQPERRHAGF